MMATIQQKPFWRDIFVREKESSKAHCAAFYGGLYPFYHGIFFLYFEIMCKGYMRYTFSNE